MANYIENLQAFPVAAGLPSSLSAIWDAQPWSVVDVSGDKFLRRGAMSLPVLTVATLDIIDADPNRDNVEVLCNLQMSAVSAEVLCGVMLRASGASLPTASGYVCVLVGPNRVRWAKLISGALTYISDTTLGTSFPANTSIWMRARGDGDDLKVKIWYGAVTAEPVAWSAETVDNSYITSFGGAGVIASAAGISFQFGQVAIATNGGTASFVADTSPPVLSSPTGITTGATTASGTVLTTDANGLLFYLASINATESASTVVASGRSQAVTSIASAQSVAFTNLNPATLYWAHYVHIDSSGNVSARISSSSFVTSSVVVPPVGKPDDISRPLDNTQIINFYGLWNIGSRYERYQRHVVGSGTSMTLTFQKQDLYNGGGVLVPLTGTTYVLNVDGVPVATSTVAAGATKGTFTVSLVGMAKGYRIFEVVPQGTETTAPIPVYIPGGPAPEWMPVFTGSYDAGNQGHDPYRIMWVPATYAPTAVPLPTGRTYTHFNTAVSKTLLNLEALVVHRKGNDVRRPVYDNTGAMTTAFRQWYTTDDMIRKYPSHPLVDGPRGMGCLGYLMHLEVGTAAPVETGPINNSYGVSPWSIVKIRESGECKTLSGYRHKASLGNIGPYWGDTISATSLNERLELVGDWSAIPPERWGYRELWGMAWNSDSFVIDQNAPTIPTERNLHPHDDYISNGVAFTAGIAMVVTDSQNNRVILNKFSPISHSAAPTVYELITGLQDPWDIIEWGDHYIISERKANRIVKYTKTGIYVETIVEGAMGLAEVTTSRLIQRNVSQQIIRQQPVCLPEGLYRIKDNSDDWLYYASAAMGQIRRIHMVTRQIQICQSSDVLVSGVWTPDTSPPIFRKIAVSDGTFGPRGTMFMSNWKVTNQGFPHAYLPGGEINFDPESTARPTTQEWPYIIGAVASRPRGRGGYWGGWGYTGAVGVGNGRLIGGGADEGIYEITLANPADPLINITQYVAGRDKWRDMGYLYTHGQGGYGYYGLPLPWGVDPDIDYYLTSHRHVKP